MTDGLRISWYVIERYIYTIVPRMENDFLTLTEITFTFWWGSFCLVFSFAVYNVLKFFCFSSFVSPWFCQLIFYLWVWMSLSYLSTLVYHYASVWFPTTLNSFISRVCILLLEIVFIRYASLVTTFCFLFQIASSL